MRRDLEEWLKGKTENLKDFETPGKYAGLPVVRLAPLSEGDRDSIPRGTERHTEPPKREAVSANPLLHEVRGLEEKYGLAPQREPDVPSPSASGSGERTEEFERFDSGPGEPVLSPAPKSSEEEPFRETTEAASRQEEAPSPETETAENDAADAVEGLLGLKDGGASGEEPVSGSPGNLEASGTLPVSDDGLREPEMESDRDARLTERLRRVTQMRRAAMEAARREQTPRHRVRIVVLGVVLVLLLAGVWLFYLHAQRNSQGFIAQEAQRLYDEENYEGAAELYQRGFDRYPGSLEFLLGLARASEKAGQPEQSLKAWRLYLNQIPKEENAIRAQALYEVGRLYALMREPEKAIEHLVQSSNLDSTGYGTHFVLGRLLEEQNRPTEALNAYRHALDVRPSSPEALDAVKRVAGLLVPPPEPEPQGPGREYEKHLEVGTVALNLKRYDEAESHFAQALKIRSDDERPWLGLAGAHQGKGKGAEALKMLRETQALLPDSVTVRAKIEELEGSLAKEAPASPAKRRRTPSKRNSRRS